MKKCSLIFVFLLALTNILSVGNITFAADVNEALLGKGDTYYSFDSAKKVLTIGGHGAVPDYASSDLQPWKNWRKSGNIDRIVICEGITYIGNHFLESVQAAVIELPESLTRIGSYAFADNYELESVEMRNVISISNNAFGNCSSLKAVYIPKTVTSIGSNAFDNCAELEKVEFESMNMKLTVFRGAFMRCPEISEINIPRYATLATYSIGFYEESIGSVYENLTLGVFSDSNAYTYANSRFIKYRFLDSMVIEEGAELDCAYNDNNIDEQIKYYFTPTADVQYVFYSTGKVDVDCELTDSSGNVIAVAEDNSLDDLNFKIECVLKAGTTYCFTVKSVNSVGEYTLHFLPSEIDSVNINWNISLQAENISDGNINIAQLIKGLSVNFVYEGGYVYRMPFEEGAEYKSMSMHYKGILEGSVTCGNNKDFITVGDTELEFNINVNHSYISEVTEPSVSSDGYTKYTCILCGDSYKTDFTECLGTAVSGHIGIMCNPQGDIIAESSAAEVYIYNNEGEYVGCTDSDGNFSVDYAYDYLTFETPFGPCRKVNIEKDVNNLGEIGVIYCDFCCDGYINAKDFSQICQVFGEYESDDPIAVSLDVNNNGVLDSGDWEYAENFFSYGKLNESIYDN